MVASIQPGAMVIATRFQSETRHKESVKSASDGASQAVSNTDTDDGPQVTLHQKMLEMADDMANLSTQFRNRREFEKKGAAASEDFERVLDQEAAPKAQKLVQVLALPHLSVDQLMAQARSLFADDSDLYLVLKELLKRKQLSALQRKRIETLLETVTKEAAPKILKGGIHCALKARLFGVALGLDAALLRQTYRRFLESQSRPLQEYEDWIVSYGYQARHSVLDFVEESLGTDIRAQDPSCSRPEFSDLLAQMRKLHQLRSADREFVRALLGQQLLPMMEQEEADWLLLLCALLKEDMPAHALLSHTLATCLLPTHAARSIWLNAVRSAYKRLPPEVFESAGGPAHDPAAVMSAFDQLIDTTYAAELLEQRLAPRHLPE